MFGIYSYLVTILIFCGFALVLYFIDWAFHRESDKITYSDWKSIFWTIIIFLVITGSAEFVALNWGAWEYSAQRTLHKIFLGAEIETYLFTILVSLMVAIATIVYARHEEKRRSQ